MKTKHEGKSNRRSLLYFILAGCVFTIIFLTVSFFTLRWPITSTEAYQDAMRRVRTNPRLLEELGSPISAGWRIRSSRHNEEVAGILEFTQSISGPKKSGTLFCRARMVYREWSFDLLEAKINGTMGVIDLRYGR